MRVLRTLPMVVLSVLALAGAAQAPVFVAAQGLPTTVPIRQGYRVSDYGARPEHPELDSTDAFRAALSTAASNGGGVVSVPFGRYWFKGTLAIDHGVVLAGEGRGPYDPMFSVIDKAQGPTLLVRAEAGATGRAFITITGANSGVEDLIFAYPDQVKANDPGVGNAGPHVYPPTIRALQPAKIRRSTFCNGYQDIDVQVGRVTLDSLYLGGLKNSVTVDNAWDVVRINSSVVEPFSDWGLRPPQGLDFWMWNNATAIIARKVDSLQINDTLIYGRNVGLSFEASPLVPDGAVSGMASNVNCDTVRYCVIARATEERVGFAFSNLLMGPVPDGGKIAVWLPRGDLSLRPRISIVGGSIRHKWPRDFVVEKYADGTPVGELSVKSVIGYDLGPRL